MLWEKCLSVVGNNSVWGTEPSRSGRGFVSADLCCFPAERAVTSPPLRLLCWALYNPRWRRSSCHSLRSCRCLTSVQQVAVKGLKEAAPFFLIHTKSCGCTGAGGTPGIAGQTESRGEPSPGAPAQISAGDSEATDVGGASHTCIFQKAPQENGSRCQGQCFVFRSITLHPPVTLSAVSQQPEARHPFQNKKRGVSVASLGGG